MAFPAVAPLVWIAGPPIIFAKASASEVCLLCGCFSGLSYFCSLPVAMMSVSAGRCWCPPILGEDVTMSLLRISIQKILGVSRSNACCSFLDVVPNCQAH